MLFWQRNRSGTGYEVVRAVFRWFEFGNAEIFLVLSHAECVPNWRRCDSDVVVLCQSMVRDAQTLIFSGIVHNAWSLDTGSNSNSIVVTSSGA